MNTEVGLVTSVSTAFPQRRETTTPIQCSSDIKRVCEGFQQSYNIKQLHQLAFCENSILMNWTTPVFSPEEVDAAGDILISNDTTTAELNHALDIVSNWRSCHSFPLNTFQVALRRNAEAISKGHTTPLVAQRIKRFPAIVHKLDRLRYLKLSEIQDIGGCRAVVTDIGLVHALRSRYDNLRSKHIISTENDYIAKPKKSGYRGIHLVYRYASGRNQIFNGLKVEIQLRSQLQHAWATAVETASMFSAQFLKSSQGDKQWLRFFALMGSIIAMKEGASIVPGTSETRKEIVEEIKDIESALDIRNRLMGYGTTLKLVQPNSGAYYYILSLNAKDGSLTVKGYKRSDSIRAEREYGEIERASVGNPAMDTVLVSVDSIKQLRAAFPNYYLDTRRFIHILDNAIRAR